MKNYFVFYTFAHSKRPPSGAGDTKLNNKIGLSNEDHCGSCGQYAITKTESNQQNISTDDKNDANTKV